MKEKIIEFKKNAGIYRKLAEEKIERGDYISALGFLFEAKKAEPDSLEVLIAIADAYADMDLLELSNQYWYYYLDKAPASRRSMAYVELAINFFYMKKMWASGYYFQKKMELDGYISPDGIDPEITDFFSDMASSKPDIHVVSSEDKADYSEVIRMAGFSMAEEDYQRAIEELQTIPENCRDEETSGQLAFAYFLCKEDENMLAECRASLARDGENPTAYCNLATYYAENKNSEKGEFYLKKAEECLKTQEDYDKYAFKMSSAAMDLGEHALAEKHLGIYLEKARYDVSSRLMRSIALMNLQRYEEAEMLLAETRRIAPDDTVLKYYSRLAQRLTEGEKGAEKLRPLAYTDDLPAKQISLYKRAVKDLVSKRELSEARQEYIKEVVDYGADCGDDIVAKSSFLLNPACVAPGSMLGKGKVNKEEFALAVYYLMKTSISLDVKASVIHTLIESGCRSKFGVATETHYICVKPRKMLFEGKEGGERYTDAYALGLIRLTFSGIEEEGKFGFALNKLYSNHADSVTEYNFGINEIAAVAFRLSGLGEIFNVSDVCAMFAADSAPVAAFVKNVLGEDEETEKSKALAELFEKLSKKGNNDEDN